MATRAHRIESAVKGWPGAAVDQPQLGVRTFRVGDRVLGRLHGDRLLEVPLPAAVRDRLVEEGRLHQSCETRDSGWVACCIRTADDVRAAIDLLRANYERVGPGREAEAEQELRVDEASLESFPASDPPAYVATSGAHPAAVI